MCISGVCVRRVLSAGGGHGVWQPRAACRDTSRSCLQDGRRGDFALTYKQKSVETFWRRHTRPYCQCSCPRRYWRCLLLFFNGATQTGATECGRNSSSSSQTDSRFLHCHWQTDRQINRQTDRQAGRTVPLFKSQVSTEHGGWRRYSGFIVVSCRVHLLSSSVGLKTS